MKNRILLKLTTLKTNEYRYQHLYKQVENQGKKTQGYHKNGSQQINIPSYLKKKPIHKL